MASFTTLQIREGFEIATDFPAGTFSWGRRDSNADVTQFRVEKLTHFLHEILNNAQILSVRSYLIALYSL